MTEIIQVVFPAGIFIIMLGLGLTLRTSDFARVVKAPKAVFIALTCQIVVLPVLCFGLVLALRLEPALAVGMMLLAATPGGTTANLLSHIAGGDLALNVTLTAINSVTSIITMPVLLWLSAAAFLGEGAGVGLQAGSLLQVLVLVGIPVVLGMVTARQWPAFAESTQKAFKVGSLGIIVLVMVMAITNSFSTLIDNLVIVGTAVLLFCILSVVLGYWIPRGFRIVRAQRISSSMEIGIHNGGLAMTLAYTVLNNPDVAIPAVIHSVLMFVPAGIAVAIFTRGNARDTATSGTSVDTAPNTVQ